VFSKRTIKPKMLLVISYLNEFLVPRYGDDLYLTFIDPTPDDKAARTGEALSGLARAFFYAGARALLVSNWAVESETTVKLMTAIFATIAKNPKLNRSEALRQAMLVTMDDRSHPEWANPSAWAPFVLVGEGGVMTR
jgi:hypothetical protein